MFGARPLIRRRRQDEDATVKTAVRTQEAAKALECELGVVRLDGGKSSDDGDHSRHERGFVARLNELFERRLPASSHVRSTFSPPSPSGRSLACSERVCPTVTWTKARCGSGGFGV